MKELVEYIVRALVDKPDEVEIKQSDSEGLTILEIKVAADEVGKVIGKEGRIANAIRTIAKSAGARDRKRITVEIMTREQGGM